MFSLGLTLLDDIQEMENLDDIGAHVAELAAQSLRLHPEESVLEHLQS